MVISIPVSYTHLAKSEHNEAAPAQHELASVFDIANVDCDRNQLVMEVLHVVAKEKGLACLLPEKPFRGTNGSGKHHNYSLEMCIRDRSTSSGRFGTSMSAHRILGLYSVPRVWLFAN